MIISNGFGFIYKFKIELIYKLLERNYEVTVIAKNENEDNYLYELSKLNVNIIEINMERRKINFFLEIRLFLKLLKIIIKNKPFYIYTYTIKPNIYVGILSLIFNIRFSPTITGLGSCYYNKKFQTLLKIIYKIAFKNSEKIFFENKSNLNIFIENKLVKKNKTILLNGSGVNLNKFYMVEKIPKKESLKILFLGRIMKEKGIEEYLEVAKKFKKFKITFYIVGNFEENKYKKIIKEYSDINIVKYLGVKKDVREIIKKIDILIQPSHHEGMSNVILEASAMGKIVLASNIPGCREAIYSDKYLFEVKDSESLLKCLKNNLNFTLEDINNQRNHIIKNFNRENIILENIRILE